MPPRTAIKYNALAFCSAFIGVLGGAWTGGTRVLAIADTRYVQSSDYKQRLLTDSLTTGADIKDILHRIASMDSSLKCDHHKTEFCR